MNETFNVEQAIASCQRELADLAQTKTNIEQRIAALQQTLFGLLRLKAASADKPKKVNIGQLMGQIGLPMEGMTEQIRRTIRLAQGVPLTPMQVKEQLEGLGFDFSKYQSNPLSSIHTTLKRLQQAGEVEPVEILGHGTAYRWCRYGK